MLTGSKNQRFSSQPETQFYYGQFIADMSFHQGRLLAYFYDLQKEEIVLTVICLLSGAFGELLPKGVKLLCTKCVWQPALQPLCSSAFCTCTTWCKMVRSFRSKRSFLRGQAACKKRVKQKRKAARFYFKSPHFQCYRTCLLSVRSLGPAVLTSLTFVAARENPKRG